VSGNKATSPVENLNRLSEIKIPTRKQLPICCYRFLGGDYPALSRLAGDLYGFASKCNSEVTQLAGYVEKLIGDSGRWQGQTADAFRYSFGGDAMLINGLAKTTSACAQVIDNLAYNLSYLESKIEAELIRGVENGYFSLSVHYMMGDQGLHLLANNLKTGLIPTVRADSGLAGKNAGLAAGALCESALAAAKKYRKSAASQLAVLCAPISKALDTYTSGEQKEREPFGLLRPDQIASDTKGIKSLQEQFQEAGQAAGLTAPDVKNASISLKKLGGDAETIGGIVSDLKGWKNADFATKFSSGKNAIESIGPILNDIALLVRLAPK
jgi:hypothetical protein